MNLPQHSIDPSLQMALRGVRHYQTLAARGQLGLDGVGKQARLIALAEKVLGRALTIRDVQFSGVTGNNTVHSSRGNTRMVVRCTHKGR